MVSKDLRFIDTTKPTSLLGFGICSSSITNYITAHVRLNQKSNRGQVLRCWLSQHLEPNSELALFPNDSLYRRADISCDNGNDSEGVLVALCHWKFSSWSFVPGAKDFIKTFFTEIKIVVWRRGSRLIPSVGFRSNHSPRNWALVLSLKSWMKHVRGSGDNLLGERQSHGGEPCIRTGDVRPSTYIRDTTMELRAGDGYN